MSTLIFKSANVAAVTRLAPEGAWCITFNETIPLERRTSAVVTAAYWHGIFVNSTLVSSSCFDGLEVRAFAASAQPVPLDTLFTFLVP